MYLEPSLGLDCSAKFASNAIANFDVRAQCLDAPGSDLQTSASSVDILEFRPLAKVSRRRVSESRTVWNDCRHETTFFPHESGMAQDALGNMALDCTVSSAGVPRPCDLGCAQVGQSEGLYAVNFQVGMACFGRKVADLGVFLR